MSADHCSSVHPISSQEIVKTDKVHVEVLVGALVSFRLDKSRRERRGGLSRWRAEGYMKAAAC